jgi:amino acid adenylation domain-containing protein
MPVDTIWLGACLLTWARWSGQSPVHWREGASGAAPVLSADVDDDESTQDWLRRLDRTRMAAVMQTGSRPEPEDVLVWAASPREAERLSADVVAAARMPGAGVILWLTEGQFDQRVLQSWLDDVNRTAAAMAQGMQTPVGEHRIAACGEARSQVQPPAVRWSHDGPLTVTACFDLQVTARGDDAAVIDGDLTLSYRELDRRATRWAVRLREAGVVRGDIVALVMERGATAIVAQLAILRAQAAYLPLDPDFPPERITFMLADARARCVVVDAGSAAAGLPPDLPVLRLGVDDVDRAGEEPSARADGAALAVAEPIGCGDADAYVMYTSGSTGQPKGVIVPQAAIVRLVKGAQYMTLDASVRMLHAAPLGFDAATLEIWGPLLNGGCCVVHAEKVPTGAALARTIAAHGVTTAWLTAALFNAVVDDDPRHLRGLRELLTGGEALSVAHVAKALAALPDTQLINGYGPTECTTFAATHRITAADLSRRSIPIGNAITATQLWVLNARGEPVPRGAIGELFIGGRGVARGYLSRPELTAEKFVPDPFGAPGGRLYRTGDRVRWLPGGVLDFIGRNDGQVKLRGRRIELGEIEATLQAQPGVRAAVAVVHDDERRGAELVAYVVADADARLQPPALRDALARRLPEFMVPLHYVFLDALPRTPNGKLDRRALPKPARARPDSLAHPFVAPQPGAEARVAELFASLLDVDRVGALDAFFDLGGNSLLVVRAVAQLRQQGFEPVTVASLYQAPTPRALAALLDARAPAALAERRRTRTELGPEPVAVVGMAVRLPGAATVEAFWDLLREGREGIRFFLPEELDASIPRELRDDPAYVRARGVIDQVEDFDAEFFGIAAREAELMDPQHRIFLELCWECLERAGHVPERYAAPIGVFAGMYNASYFQKHVLAHPERIARLGEFQVMLANEKDYITTRAAHKLDLTGPAVAVHTACSTSLVAVAQAFEALQAGQCGMALAGGVSVTCPPASGYLYQEGSMLSPDGHTRTFDAAAQGTVFSDGAAVVLLKRLSDAIADGNTIHAVIRGVAVNNDGAQRASFTAPTVDGQSAVVEAALQRAGVPARSIDYIEAHGTATPLGDPVEVAALRQAFARQTQDVGFCALGSAKSNLGHTVIAAGATGLIKVALSLAHEHRPGTVHFSTPNPKIGLEGSPFRIQADGEAWPRRSQRPRRAGVSSFGVGGTNAHAVLEEAPLPEPSSPPSGPQVLRLSARTPAALAAACRQLADHLQAQPQLNLADVAFTLDEGRRTWACRAAVAGSDAASVAEALRSTAAGATADKRAARVDARPRAVFVFPGQGSQYPHMGQALAAGNGVFRAAYEEALAALQVHTVSDLRAALAGDDSRALEPTAVTQPATFCVEYALARTWQQLGVEPDVLIGHSVGEFAAAVIAGVMSLSDAARLVARRGAIMQAQPGGSMLSVRAAADDVRPRLPDDLQLAADNGPRACVVAGPTPSIEAFAADLGAAGLACQVLHTSHAFHSAMMDAAVPEFEALVRGVALSAPQRRIVSTLTGTWLRDGEATDPRYWARHLRETVRFAPAVRTVLAEGDTPPAVFVEVGPRTALTTLVRQQLSEAAPGVALASLSDHGDGEVLALARAAAALWVHGLPVVSLSASGKRRRLVLPTYPFERRRHWVDAWREAAGPAVDAAVPVPVPSTALASEATALPAIPASSSGSELNTMTTPRPPADRRAALVQRLRSVFEDVSGLELADADAGASFVELGLDSLTLTQVALQLKKEFSLPITFRQLMEQLRSFDALGAHLDAQLPAEVMASAASTPAAPSAPVSPSAGVVPVLAALPALAVPAAGAPFVQQVIHQQMTLMAQQLALLQGLPAGAASAANAVTAAAQTDSPAGTPTPAPPTIAPAPAATPVTACVEPAKAASIDEEAALAHRTYDVKKAFGAIARIHTGGAEISERQRARLGAFMQRYIDKTRRSKDYTISHRPHMADPRVVNGFRPLLKEIIYQIVIERSKGARMWDLDGNEYVDALNGFGMSLFGWQPDFVVEAVKKQLDSGYDIGPQHPLAGDVAELVCELTGFDRAALCNTGSEAVMGCVRIARTVTGRNRIVIFSGAYHGIFDEVIVRGTKKGKAVPAAPGILANTAENVVVLDYGTPETLQWIKANAHDLAAVLVEPVQSRRPDFQPKDFLRELRTVTEQSGALLIFDEVVTGFRSHPGGIQALFGIRADLSSYGKVVGGGFPIGVIAGQRAYMDALDGGHWEYGDDSIPTVGVTYFAGTFVRHPLALVAAKAVLEHLKREGPELQAALTRRTAAMVDELNAYCRQVGAPIVLKSFASVWKVFFEEEHPLQDLLFAMMRNRGVHILDNFPCFMTTAHTAQDIAVIKSAFKEAVAELQESDFMPRHLSAQAAAFDASRPPVPGARLGRDADGNPAWFIANPQSPGKYIKVEA